MNTNTNNNAQTQELAAAVTALTQVIEEAIKLAKEEEAVTSTTTEATATTAETTTTAAETTTTAAETTTTTEDTTVIVLDDDDSVAAVGFKGSMIEQDPMDPIPTYEENAAEANADTAEAEETVTADTEEMIDKIICDISTLYDVAEFALCHEGKNIDSDHSPYAPTDNRRGLIGDYQVFISKEITKDGDHIEGSFRLVVKDKVIVNPIMDLEIRLIDDHYKIFSSENTRRIEQMKEDHNLMRFLEITDEVSALVMSKYISK